MEQTQTHHSDDDKLCFCRGKNICIRSMTYILQHFNTIPIYFALKRFIIGYKACARRKTSGRDCLDARSVSKAHCSPRGSGAHFNNASPQPPSMKKKKGHKNKSELINLIISASLVTRCSLIHNSLLLFWWDFLQTWGWRNESNFHKLEPNLIQSRENCCKMVINNLKKHLHLNISQVPIVYVFIYLYFQNECMGPRIE